jgi:hypothetical protein
MKSTYLKRPLLAAIAAIAALAFMAPVAQGATAPGYERFAGCPTPAESPTTVNCMRAVIKGGHFKMGSKNVPISKPMTLTGGTDSSLGNFKANAQGGLTPVPQQVPGGVIGLTGLDWLVNFLDIDSLQLFAVTELVGQPSVGEAFNMPVRVHLINPVLGKNCYVGSPTNPIKLSLGEQVPASFKYHEATQVSTFTGGVFADTTFSAPGATGCTLTLFGFIPISINGLVNTQSGLPSPSGNNTTVQNIDLEITGQSNVYP